jgi:hypothetical protein
MEYYDGKLMSFSSSHWCQVNTALVHAIITSSIPSTTFTPTCTNTVPAYISFEDDLIGESGASTLGCALQYLTCLLSLDLEYNLIGASGAAALAPSLTVMTGLQKLYLLYLLCNDLGAEGAAALAPSLRVMIGLQFLNLDSNNFGAEGAASL